MAEKFRTRPGTEPLRNRPLAEIQRATPPEKKRFLMKHFGGMLREDGYKLHANAANQARREIERSLWLAARDATTKAELNLAFGLERVLIKHGVVR